MKFESAPGPAKTEKGPKKERDVFYGAKKKVWGLDWDIAVGSKEKDMEIRGDLNKKEVLARTNPEMFMYLARKAWGYLNDPQDAAESKSKPKPEAGLLGRLVGVVDNETLGKFTDLLGVLDQEEKNIIFRNMSGLEGEELINHVSNLTKHSPQDTKELISYFKEPQRTSRLDDFLKPFVDRMEKHVAEEKRKKAEENIRDFASQEVKPKEATKESPKPVTKSEEELVKDMMDIFKKL